MKRLACGSIHHVTDRFYCLRYQPTPDFHIPLALHDPGEAALHGWSIQLGEPGEAPVYLVMIRLPEAGMQGEPFCGMAVELETQFGSCRIAFVAISPLSVLSEAQQGEALALIFRNLAGLTFDVAREILAALPADVVDASALRAERVETSMLGDGLVRIDIAQFITTLLFRTPETMLCLVPHQQRLVEAQSGFALECDIALEPAPGVQATPFAAFWPGGYSILLATSGGALG